MWVSSTEWEMVITFLLLLLLLVENIFSAQEFSRQGSVKKVSLCSTQPAAWGRRQMGPGLLLLSHLSHVLLCATHRWQPTRLPHPWDSPGKNIIHIKFAIWKIREMYQNSFLRGFPLTKIYRCFALFSCYSVILPCWWEIFWSLSPSDAVSFFTNQCTISSATYPS